MSAQLHKERIFRTGSDPARWLVMTHGIYGAGSNWRGIARKISDARPEWGVVLVDLRGHGRSEHGAAPHDIAACAEDLRAVIGELGHVEAIAGHSFGGKVVLATRTLVHVRQTWILDSSPSARPDAVSDPDNTSARVLELMERLPRTWARRDDFTAAVVAAGHSPMIAQWLAMNVVPDDTGTFALRLDLPQLRALLTDYYARDLWGALYDPARGDVELVIADRSSTVSAADRARLASAPPHVHVTHLDTGHWLNAEAPAAVVELFVRKLP
jgi:pimeloyl-ACP methyl ester carboxylesterase